MLSHRKNESTIFVLVLCSVLVVPFPDDRTARTKKKQLLQEKETMKEEYKKWKACEQ